VLFACNYDTSIAIDVSSTTGDANDGVELYKIEGTASLPRDAGAKKNWRSLSRVLVNHGQYIGFIRYTVYVRPWITRPGSRLSPPRIARCLPCFREDGQFTVSGVPAGSYIVEISNVDFVFEPVRVDITSKGKMRARRLNVLQVRAITLHIEMDRYANESRLSMLAAVGGHAIAVPVEAGRASTGELFPPA
jgi:hypothetical protein